MPIVLNTEYEDNAVITEDIYTLRFKHVEERVFNPDYGPGLLLTFEILDGPYAGQEGDRIVSKPKRLQSNTNVFPYIEALLGRKLGEKEKWMGDLEGFYGTERKGLVQTKTLDDGRSFHKVTRLMMPVGGRRTAVAQRPFKTEEASELPF